MYIQLRNREPEAGSKAPRIRSVQEVARFVTHASGDVDFREWRNEEIRLQPPPSDPDLKNHRIDLNAGFTRYYEEHVRRVRRSNGCHTLHHNDARHLEKDDTMRKSFEATLKWIKETDFVRRSSPISSSPSSSSSPSPSMHQQQPQQQDQPLPAASASASSSSSGQGAPAPPVRLITTSSAIHQLLQLPYENEEKNCPSWLVSKHQGILYLFSIETYTNPTLLAVHSDAGNNKFNIRHHHIFQSEHFHHNGHCNGHTNGNGCIDMGEKVSELLRYRSKVFYNMMTERLPLDRLHEKSNKCVLNRAVFDDRTILYSAVVNAVDADDRYVDLKLTLNRKSRREHLEKMQRLWSIAVLKPAQRIVLGVRSGKSKDVNAVPDGRLIRIDDLDLRRLPHEVVEFSHKAQYDAPLWQPQVSFDFLKRVLDYLETRVMDDARTVYQLVPEGFYGRGFSLLSIHKLNLKGCDPLIPEWYVSEPDEPEEEELDGLSAESEVLVASLSETSVSETSSE